MRLDMEHVTTVGRRAVPVRRTGTAVTRQRVVSGLVAIALAGALTACGGDAAPAAPVTTDGARAATAPSLSVAPAVTAIPAAAQSNVSIAGVPGGTLRFDLAAGQSKATFRVREQLAGHDLPNDAVGSTTAVTGQIILRPDGTVVQDGSRITVDIASLATDQATRDRFIKSSTLQTRQFPSAEFVPTKADGIPSPLPDSGEYHFTLTGLMTIHGVQKEIAWDVTAKRDGSNLAGTATTEFKFGDFGMTPPRAPAVLSVVDDIRLEVNLVATQAA